MNVVLFSVQVPESRRKGHVDRLRAEEKWQSRARLTETSFGFLEAQRHEAQLPFDTELQRQAAGDEGETGEDWQFQRPHVCIIDALCVVCVCSYDDGFVSFFTGPGAGI